jgi:hypothetical protein
VSFLWFLVVGFDVRYPFPEIRDEVPENFKATADYADNTDGLLVPVKHTDDAKEEELTPGISGVWPVSWTKTLIS